MNGQGMRGLLGREIKINRGGPDSVTGTLMDVRWDYMAMSCKEGIVYVNETHVKSITDTGRSGGNRTAAMGNPIPSNTFLGVMQALRFRRVQINRGGPEKVEGILADANQNQLILALKNQEIVRIPLQHVKSVSIVRGSNNNNSNNSNNSNNNGNNTSQGNQAAQGNRSQGNQAAQGNQSQGNQAAQGNRGNRSQGAQQGAQGNQSRGNRSQGAQGNRSRGNQGNQSKGNKSGGNKSGGNKSGGKKRS
jgi:spore coat protein B